MIADVKLKPLMFWIIGAPLVAGLLILGLIWISDLDLRARRRDKERALNITLYQPSAKPTGLSLDGGEAKTVFVDAPFYELRYLLYRNDSILIYQFRKLAKFDPPSDCGPVKPIIINEARYPCAQVNSGSSSPIYRFDSEVSSSHHYYTLRGDTIVTLENPTSGLEESIVVTMLNSLRATNGDDLARQLGHY